MISFGSDNHTGVHPLLLEAIRSANQDHAPSYGTDSWSERAADCFRAHFGSAAETFFVFNGTGANVVSLRALLKPWESCLVSSISHLNQDECGAPESFAGKLIPLPTSDGKLTVEQLQEALIRRGDQHYAQIKAVSLSQPTELGTCYSLEELAAIAGWAKSNGLKIHVDGARLSNAVVFLKTDFKSMVSELGIDLLSFGGTKNGLMMGEAVVAFDSSLKEDLKYIRKQSLQLPSKTRFISAQFESYLGTGLWKEIADHSHRSALSLRELVLNLRSVKITQATESNAVFARIPKNWVKPLREKYFFYVWDPMTTECRWMTSWDTRREYLDGFYQQLQSLEETQ